MDYSEIVHLVNNDSVVQNLLSQAIPMRLGYVGLDGLPRTVPVAYIWNGREFVFATPTIAYKVKAIEANPGVSFTIDSNGFPPLIALVRGTASIEVRQGLPQEHVDASRRMMSEEMFTAWERNKRETVDEMAVVTIVPTHITVCDFETRFPPPVEVNAPAHGAS